MIPREIRFFIPLIQSKYFFFFAIRIYILHLRHYNALFNLIFNSILVKDKVLYLNHRIDSILYLNYLHNERNAKCIILSVLKI